MLYKNRESGKWKCSFDKQNPDSSCEQTIILGVSKTHFEFLTPRFSRSGIYTNRIFPRRKYPETPFYGWCKHFMNNIFRTFFHHVSGWSAVWDWFLHISRQQRQYQECIMPDYSFVSEYLFARLSKCGGQFQQTFGSIFVQCACPVFDNIQK